MIYEYKLNNAVICYWYDTITMQARLWENDFIFKQSFHGDVIKSQIYVQGVLHAFY